MSSNHTGGRKPPHPSRLMEYVVYKSFTISWVVGSDHYGPRQVCNAEISIPEDTGAILCGMSVGPDSWPMFITDKNGMNVWIRQDIADLFDATK